VEAAMTFISRFVRYLGVLQDPKLEPGTIAGLPPFALRKTLDALLKANWIKTFEYNGDDAWVEYARVDLRKGRSKLRLEWDPDSGGSVEGPRTALQELHVLDPWTHLQGRMG
jgi:hypothetical protein